MPLHGKIVVIKRTGGDGTEFPLTATCLFGRKPDCDIRIQLPQVSKEHCRIDFNENKEVVLTNLSSVNPTRVNGEAMQQSERLKHGDVITIIDRSFRFEYPPAPTPKKRSSIGGKTETFKVLQDQQVGDIGEKRSLEVSTDPHLKDGTNHDNIQRSLDKTVEVEPKEDGSLLQSKTTSPFSDLYQMIKKSLDVKTPRKSSASLLQTPTSRFCTPMPGSVQRNDGHPVISTEDKSTPQKNESKDLPGTDETKGEAESKSDGTPKAVKKQRKSFQGPTAELAGTEAENAAKSEGASPHKRNRATPQRFSACEVIEQVSAQTPKSPMRRRSKEATPVASPKQPLRKASPRNSGKAEKVNETSKKRKSGELGADLPAPQMKRKRVSFGGHLSPELFDKRLPPDSPLRKGAAPRRSLCLPTRNQSLLRRASVIGLIKEFEQEQPAKRRTSLPKKSSSAKKASPKTPTPAKKSPKSRTPSPKAASPAKNSPKSRTPSPKATSPARGRSPSKKEVETPKPKNQRKSVTQGVQTPTVQGRFSVSRISTPSPVAEDAVTDQVSSVTVTPKIPLRRKSTAQKTPSVAKSAVKVMRRRSGISRASMKLKNSWADIVKFGPTKAQVAAPAKKVGTMKTTKKVVSKPQTPARKLMGHVGTGHADSPVTIVVGRAHNRKVTHPTGAAPRLVTNTAVLKKNMKMDEDLTGVLEMFKTPANKAKRRTVINETSATKTPVGGQGTFVIEPSVLNTPEEPGEMMVSPLSISSTVIDGSYNSEAVQRLLNEDQESSFLGDIPALEMCSDDSTTQKRTDLKTTSATTPKQKPELPECLTGVKRIMKTPRQKAEPIEDLRGRLLRTPRQKPEQQECLTGVKRIMKTPRQKAEPIEDLRGKILKTPEQRPEQQQDECLTGVKRIFDTPKREAEPAEDLQAKLLETPKAPEAGVKETVETPAHVRESEATDMTTPNGKSSPSVCLSGIKRIMVTPRERSAPVEEMVGVKRLMKSPRLSGDAPVEDFEGLQELMEEPLTELQTDTQVEDQTPPECGGDDAKDLDFEPRDDVPSDVIDDVPQADMEKEADANEVVADEHLEEVHTGHDDNESSDSVETVSQAAIEEDLPVEEPKMDTADEIVSEEQPEAEAAAAEATEHPEDAVVPAPVRGRRGKKTEATAPTPVRQTTRRRNAKTTESRDVELVTEKSAPLPSKVALKPKRGRNAKQASDDGAETETVPEPESERSSSVDVVLQEATAPLEEAALKPKRGRKTKPEQSVPEQQEVPQAEAEANEVCSDQLEVMPSGSDEKTSPDAMDTVSQAPVTESLPQVAEMEAAIVQKKSARGRRANMVDSEPAEDKREATERCEDAVVPAPVRGRRGKKTEAVAPPAVRQTTRSRNAKSQESDQPEILPEKSVETTLVTESDQTSVNTHQEDNDSAAPAEEVVVKPIRGRKTKQTPAEPPKPEKTEVVNDDHLMAHAQPQKPKPTRGRKTKPNAAEQNEAAEDACVAVETKQQSQPPVRAKRGRNAKQEEATLENDDKITSSDPAKPQEPVKKTRRTRKAEQDHVEPREEVQTVEMVVPAEAEAPLVAKPAKMNEHTPVAAKPRRGGRKAKQDIESETLVASTEVQDVPAVISTDKPKRGRRGKQATEEVGVSAVVPEEVEEKNNAEPDAPVIKPNRPRGVKTSATNDVTQAIPAKRGRRGAALPREETEAEATALVSESEPAKRGRRAEAKPTTDDATTDRANPTEDLSSAAVEDTKASKRSVKWRADVEVFAAPIVTPVKAVRGRKAKLQVDTERKNVSKDANKAEEKDLSDEVVDAQPVKRARRGAKVVEESTSEGKSVEAEAQPKTRRGRSAKK